MKKLVRPFAVGLSAALLVGQLSAQAQTGSINTQDSCANNDGSQASESVKLYYNRSASALQKILSSIATANT